MSLQFKTLDELLSDLRARLGFLTQGPSVNANRSLLTSFLQEGHDFVYSQLQPPSTRRTATLLLIMDESVYDWHNDATDEEIDPIKVVSVWLCDNCDTRISVLTQGVDEAVRQIGELGGRPHRYDTIDGKLEVQPVPNEEGWKLKIEYLAEQPRFTQGADRPGVPDRLVFLYALAQAKAHYRHPDSQAAGAAFKAMLDKQKSLQHENRRYIVGDKRRGMPAQNGGPFVECLSATDIYNNNQGG